MLQTTEHPLSTFSKLITWTASVSVLLYDISINPSTSRESSYKLLWVNQRDARIVIIYDLFDCTLLSVYNQARVDKAWFLKMHLQNQIKSVFKMVLLLLTMKFNEVTSKVNTEYIKKFSVTLKGPRINKNQLKCLTWTSSDIQQSRYNFRALLCLKLYQFVWALN